MEHLLILAKIRTQPLRPKGPSFEIQECHNFAYNSFNVPIYNAFHWLFYFKEIN